MSYVPTVWATGDVVTAEKLNKIETGIVNASGSNVVMFAYQDVSETGGFIKEVAEDYTITFYTYAELDEIYSACGGNLFAYNYFSGDARTPALVFKRSETCFEMVSADLSEPDESACHMTYTQILLDETNGYSVEQHYYTWAVTNNN